MSILEHLPAAHSDSWEWQLRGVCRSKDPEMCFHPENERGAARQARGSRGEGGLCTVSGPRHLPRARPSLPRAVRRVGRAVGEPARTQLGVIGPVG